MPSRAEGTPSLLYVAELGEAGRTLDISAEERHYLTRVCRVRPGEVVRGTDGKGRVATIRIDGRGQEIVAEVESIERLERAREIHVWCGASEGSRADWLVEKLAELGVAVWQPIQCARARWPERREERWRRLAVAAMRQSRRAFLMEVRSPLPLGEGLASIAPGAGRWLASPDGRADWAPGNGPAIGAIGPSEGFAPGEEKLLLDSGFRPVRLSDGRLRTETAALALAVRCSA
jgi:16S rRNA (uracil1498-N3)-methyltransferase